MVQTKSTCHERRKRRWARVRDTWFFQPLRLRTAPPRVVGELCWTPPGVAKPIRALAYSAGGGSYSKSFHFIGRRKGSMRNVTSPF
jgi:hypothetical protein